LVTYAGGAGAALEPRIVGDIDGVFLVPAYQRGYRWGIDEVQRLLNDLWESRGADYYLQPVVVKQVDGGRWELIDGQQRLTTLYLIFGYMKREGLQSSGASYTMEYTTRPGSHAYLQELDPDLSETNIDFFHIWGAYDCIRTWFEKHGNRKQYVANKLYQYLFETVRVIWYEAPHALDSEDLFTRLNVGRIPLTDAELVKALVLARSRGGAGRSDRAYEIAAQWDAIERDLRVPEVWAFVTGKDSIGKDSGEATHIGLLLDTLAGGPAGRDRPLFHTFETLRPRIEADPQAMWNEVVDLHSWVLGWYENRDLFHKIGYLVATRTAFIDIVQLARGRTKSAFEAELDQQIRSKLKLTRTQVVELEYPAAKCVDVLLLMNAESVRRRRQSSERYSFRAQASGSWSLEHIHAQSAERLNRADQWAAWLELHRDALLSLPGVVDVQRRVLLEQIKEAMTDLTEEKFRQLETVLIGVFSDADATNGDSMNSIFNLALLGSGDNSALSNSVFEVKRREILKRDLEGSYVPVCTRNVFLKYYTTAEGQQIHFWGAKDREGYQQAMLELIGNYVTLETEDIS
jgi:hypothetical protein